MGGVIGSATSLGKALRPWKLRVLRLERADRRHAVDQLEGAALLRRGVDALRQHELDLAGLVEPEHEAELTLATAGADLFGERGERAGIVEIDLHAGVAGLGSLLQRDDTLDSRLDRLAVRLGFDVEQDRRARLEQRARGRQQLREQCCLELAGGIRERGEGIRIARLALALASVQYRAGERSDHAAGARLGGELEPGVRAERF